MDLKNLQKPLQADEIELRIGTVKAKSGFSLLLYKTARTDRNRLDEAFGILGWQNEHYIDVNNNVICKIKAYDETSKTWISKEDVGTESYTEKEKGSYSDSFKRAGFRFGIGIELYDSPFIWIKWNDWNDKGKPKAYPNRWKIVLDDDSKGILGGFSILDDKGNLVWGKGVKNQSKLQFPEELTILEQIGEFWKDSRFKPFKQQLIDEFGGSPSSLPESELSAVLEFCKNKIKYMGK